MTRQEVLDLFSVQPQGGLLVTTGLTLVDSSLKPVTGPGAYTIIDALSRLHSGCGLYVPHPSSPAVLSDVILATAIRSRIGLGHEFTNQAMLNWPEMRDRATMLDLMRSLR